MKKARGIYRTIVRLAPAVLATGLIFAATASPAVAYYGGYGYGGYGYGGHRYGYGGHRSGGYYGGYRGYGYRPYSHRGYLGGYRGYAYRPYSYGGYYGGNGYAGSQDGQSGGGAANAQPRSPDTNPYPSPQPTPNNTPSGSGVSEGWERLADGRYARALAVFADEALSHPTEGRPKVGYALSAAAGGDLGRGAWAMRRALRIDPDAIHYVAVGETLRPRLKQLVTRYHVYRKVAGHATEAVFMLASLHYLLGDPDTARAVIDRAAADGTSSAANLKRLIDERLAEKPGDEEQRGDDY